MQRCRGAPGAAPRGSAAPRRPSQPVPAPASSATECTEPRRPQPGTRCAPRSGPCFSWPGSCSAGGRALSLNAAFVRSSLASLHTSIPPLQPSQSPLDPAVTVPSLAVPGRDRPPASPAAPPAPQWDFPLPTSAVRAAGSAFLTPPEHQLPNAIPQEGRGHCPPTLPTAPSCSGHGLAACG